MRDAISARDIAVSGLRAQRTRMNIIANNLANVNTTRTPQGGAFKRQLTILHGEPIQPAVPGRNPGVRVEKVMDDPSPLRMVYDPSHPDANKDGYVSYPNVDVAMEMVDMLSAERAYDANVAVILSSRRMRERALEIIQK